MADLVLRAAAARLADLDMDRVVARSDLRARAFQLACAAAALAAMGVGLRDPILQTWDLVRMTVVPPAIEIEVEPGPTEAREGSDVHIRARAVGVPARLPQERLEATLEYPGTTEQRTLAVDGDWQAVTVEAVEQGFKYRVAGYGVSSASYRVEVRPRPKVARIDLHYEFPAFTKMAPRPASSARVPCSGTGSPGLSPRRGGRGSVPPSPAS